MCKTEIFGWGLKKPPKPELFTTCKLYLCFHLFFGWTKVHNTHCSTGPDFRQPVQRGCQFIWHANAKLGRTPSTTCSYSIQNTWAYTQLRHECTWNQHDQSINRKNNEPRPRFWRTVTSDSRHKGDLRSYSMLPRIWTGNRTHLYLIHVKHKGTAELGQ